jgi:hypothetical protein
MKYAIDRRRFTFRLATGLGAGGRTALVAPVTIRIGWVVVPASLAPLVLEKKDILKHFGQPYVRSGGAE